MLDWQEFTKVDHNEWLARIDANLKGVKTHNDFRYEIDQNWSVSPFLSDVSMDEEVIPGPSTQAGMFILTDDEGKANERALRCLEHGAQGLVFDVNADTDFHELFKGIYLDMVTVLLRSQGEHETIKNRLQGYLVASEQNGNNIYLAAGENTVILTWDEGFKSRNTAIRNHLQVCFIKNIRPLIILQLKQNFLAQIAELRAIRRIWKNLGGKAGDLSVFSMITPSLFGMTGVHDLIVSTYLLMSAICGMSDMAVGMPYGEDFEPARLSLNIQHILQQESRLTQVTDPVAGSYLIGKLTDEMISGNSQ